MSEPTFTPGPLIVCEAYADNGALSHYELRREDTGELVVEVGDPDAMINNTERACRCFAFRRHALHQPDNGTGDRGNFEESEGEI